MVLRRDGDRWELWLEGARDLAQRIGHDLLAAFLKCFEGINRFLALEQLMFFNERMLARNVAAFDRNLRVIVLFLGSTLHELAQALDELGNCRVVERMNDRSHWQPITSLRRRWRREERLTTLRNTFGFHLGRREQYQGGLAARLEESDVQLLERGEGTKRHGSEFVLPLNALFARTSIDDTWVRAVIGMTQEAHSLLPDLLHHVWIEVLTTAGVEVIEQPGSEAPRTTA